MPVEPPPSPWQFPDPTTADADDLVGFGADLEPGTILAAYRAGLFPMPDPDSRSQGMLWWSPQRRGVLPLSKLHVSRSLRQSCRHFEIRIDTAFTQVLDACADPERDAGWITPEIASAYTRLHSLGWAHSVETWRDGELVGGLYGVAIGGLFAGESMFHHERDASKVALVALVDVLRDEYADRRLLDVQWETDHLASLGVTSVARKRYLLLLRDALSVPQPTSLG